MERFCLYKTVKLRIIANIFSFEQGKFFLCKRIEGMDWYIVKWSKYTAGWFRGEEEGEFFGIEKSAKME